MEVIATGATWRIYRDGARLLVTRFLGEIDDDASNAWRAAAAVSFEAHGWTRFGIVASTEGRATSSLASRMRSVAFLRLAATKMERVVILGDANSSFVIKTIMRAAGLPNVEMVDVAHAADVLASMR